MRSCVGVSNGWLVCVGARVGGVIIGRTGGGGAAPGNWV